MAQNGKGWMAWVLPALLAMLLSTVGAVYTGTRAEITELKTKVEKVNNVAEQVAAMKATQDEMKKAIERVEERVVESAKVQQANNEQLSAFIAGINKSNAQWQALLRDYQAFLDESRRRKYCPARLTLASSCSTNPSCWPCSCSVRSGRSCPARPTCTASSRRARVCATASTPVAGSAGTTTARSSSATRSTRACGRRSAARTSSAWFSSPPSCTRVAWMG